MVKYICPYCAETERFIIDTETNEEFGYAYDEQVRCGNCYKIFTDKLYQEFAENGKLGTRDITFSQTRRRHSTYLPCFTPFEVAQARRARCTNHQGIDSADYRYAECAKKYPNNWEAIFFDAYYKTLNSSSVETVLNYIHFVTKLHLSLFLAESALSGEELHIAVAEIVDYCVNLMYIVHRRFDEAVFLYLSGKYPSFGRFLLEMDVGMVYNVLTGFLLHNKNLYDDILYRLNETSDVLLVAFGRTKATLITEASKRFPDTFCRHSLNAFNGNEPLIETIKRTV